jgi:hypothetical protein
VTGVHGAIGFRIADRRHVPGRIRAAPHVQRDPRAARRTSYLVPLLALSGAILPTQVQLSLGPGIRFTPGRLAIVLLSIPALVALFQSGRRLLLCDFLVFATAAWMVFAGVSVAGESALSSAGGDALDLLGGYLIARGLIFGPLALDAFIRVLKVFAITAIIFAIADNVSGRLIVQDTIAAIMHTPNPPQAGFRHNMVRAASTFDHEILFGIFCALTAAILLYWERGILARSVAIGICLLGCLLSLSSASLMVAGIALCVYTYDQMLNRYPWRWPAFWLLLGALAVVFAGSANNPLGWIVSHLTLDPQTAYFRMMIWDAGLFYVGQSPFIGHAYGLFNNNIVDGSVDSIWLLEALRFGVPMVVLFFLANVAAVFPSRQQSKSAGDLDVDRMRQAFTLVILLFMFSGLTVHFWNFMWMFWGLCIGIRASLRESPI